MQRVPIDRALWWLAVAIGAAVYWVAPYPPMTDLPQHAAQMSLFRDLLLGQSPWSGEFQINPYTPYWVGYGLSLPFSLIFPVATSLKLLLTCAFLGFVWAATALRARFGADPRLDWLVLPSYFGFAYFMGFFTFLVALPFGLGFLLLAQRHAVRPSLLTGVGLLLGGVVLLAAHGLVFGFALLCGAGFLVGQTATRQLPLAALPYLALVIAALAWMGLSSHYELGFHSELKQQVDWNWHKDRLRGLLQISSGNIEHLGWLKFVLPWLALPWLMGARLHRRLDARWIPLTVVGFVLVLAPDYALQTAYLNQRFGLLLFPAWAWVFDAPRPASGVVSRRVRLAAHAALCAGVLLVLGSQMLSTWQFGREARDFDVLLEHTQPRQRALSMVIDPWSAQPVDQPAYLHYPSWYQARQQGLVDFNFAWYVPQVVRFRPERTPHIRPNFEWDPTLFDWTEHDGARYRYFFVRSDRPLGDLFHSAPCAPVTLVRSGLWTLLENQGCPARDRIARVGLLPTAGGVPIP